MKPKQDQSEALPDPSHACETIGRFYVTAPFVNHLARRRLEQIHEYFTDEKIRDTIIPIIDGHSAVSLRDLDWLVTNYAKRNNIVYTWQVHPDEPVQLINVRNLYKNWLPVWKRKLFDSFRRRQRLYFVFDGEVHQTTVAQLNFLRWADMYGVLHYLEQNLTDIAANMKHRMQQNREEEPIKKGKRRRRRELSKAPDQRCFVYNVSIRVQFDEDREKTNTTSESSSLL